MSLIVQLLLSLLLFVDGHMYCIFLELFLAQQNTRNEEENMSGYKTVFINALTGIFYPKMKFYHHLLTFKFQTSMSFFLLLNTRGVMRSQATRSRKIKM